MVLAMNNNYENELCDYLEIKGVFDGEKICDWPTTQAQTGVISLFAKYIPGTTLRNVKLYELLTFIGDFMSKDVPCYETFEFTVNVRENQGNYSADISYVGHDDLALMPFSAENGGYLINAIKTRANMECFTVKINAGEPLFWLMQKPD